MFKFHQDRYRYFDMQFKNSRDSIIPFVETHFSLPPGAKILEIGCGEGGVLKSFVEKGHTGVGVEIDRGRIALGESWMEKEMKDGNIRFIANDIFDIFSGQSRELFHLIILKDVIEHIADKE